jgi:hypothetical protein
MPCWYESLPRVHEAVIAAMGGQRIGEATRGRDSAKDGGRREQRMGFK